MRNIEISPNPRAHSGKSLLSEYRDQMVRKMAAAGDFQTKEEIQELIELADDLDLLFEHG